MYVFLLVVTVSLYLGMEMVEISDQKREIKRQKERKLEMDKYMGRI